MPLHLTIPRATPDLDGLACAIAYAELLCARYMSARAWIAGQPDPEARFVAEQLGASIDSTPPPADCVFVLVDASDLRGMPPLEPARVVEVIDHRLHHRAAELFPNASLCIEPVGAAATLIAERYRSQAIHPSPLAAKLLQAAIMSNTQALRGTITTERDRLAFQFLAELFPLDADFVERQFQARRQGILEDFPISIERERKDFEHPDGAFILSQLEFPGARQFVAECLPIIEQLGPRAMLNLVDVDDAVSLLLVPNPTFRAWVAHHARLHFDGPVAVSPGILLRKQLVARMEGRS